MHHATSVSDNLFFRPFNLKFLTPKLADVDDLFVREDLLNHYNVDNQRAEEFKSIYSFNPPEAEKHVINQVVHKVE